MSKKNKDEKWKPIKSFAEFYEISSKGRVRSCKGKGPAYKTSTPVLLKPKKVGKNHKKRGGAYYCVALRSEGKSYYKYIHRLVAEAFIPNPSGKKEVNHSDGIKKNNCAENLEWATRQENVTHQDKILRQMINGSRHFNSKLTEDKVIEIRQLYSKGITASAIARAFEVNSSTVCGIVHRKRWKHI